MKKLLSVFTAGLLCLACCGGCAPEEDPEKQKDPPPDEGTQQQEIPYEAPTVERYSNHIDIDGQWGATHNASTERGIGDPFVMRYNGKYYLYPSTSGPNDGIKVFESDDLVHWENKGYAVATSETSAYHAYAPEVIYHGGYFWMCQSRDGGGHFFYRSESPTEGFVPVSGNLGMGIDGSFYLSDEGKLYLMHTTQPHGLVYNEIKTLSQNIKGEDIGATGAIAEADLRNRWIEGPGLFRRGDFSYLTYTGNEVLCKGYRLAYSYAENIDGLQNFLQPEDNVTFLDTGEHAGLGHSSNVNGPDLDSVYTAYHSLVGVNESLRRYNVDRYFASGSILTADGATHRPVALPALPTAGEYAEGLKKKESGFVLGESDDFFTAEYNFISSEAGQYAFFGGGSYRIFVEEGTLRLEKTERGNTKVLGEAAVNFPEGRLCTVRVENGDGVGHLYFDGMRLFTYTAEGAKGEIGYAKRDGVGYTAFTNDVFGTSDFEALKNFPTKFPATTYLKGEMRGFNIQNAAQKKGGIRVGEKESTKRIGDAYAVVLRKGDWVKYAIDVEKKATFSLMAEVSADSMGGKLKITVGNSVLEATIPSFATGREQVRVYLGDIVAEGGIGTMRVECTSKKAELLLFEAYEKGSGEVSLSDYEVMSGSAQMKDGALVMSSADSALLWNNSEATDFEAELTFSCGAGDLGLMVRAFGYSFHVNQNKEGWQGYYLRLDPFLLRKYDYGDLGDFGGEQADLSDGQRHTLKITAHGNEMTFSADGVQFTAFDEYPWVRGGLGLYSHSGTVTVYSLTFHPL